MTIIKDNLIAAFAKIGVYFESDTRDKEIAELIAVIKGLIPEAENVLDLKIRRAELDAKIQELEQKLGVGRPYAGVS